jgi:TRAP-type mannitol/chloroaromatic compound transport system permease large subunit
MSPSDGSRRPVDPLRITELMEDDLLLAVQLFLYLGVVLEGMSGLFGKRAGGIGMASFIIGARPPAPRIW